MTAQMKILDLKQGSDSWKAIRSQYLVASEAPVIMGASPHMRRDELLRLKSTGLEREINEWVEKFIFKKGHDSEELARPIAEEFLGEDLYPLVAVREVEGLPLLASYDGMTAPMYDDHWEHKQYNKELFGIVHGGLALEPKHYWQLEHQLLVNGNSSCMFSCSDGTKENYAEFRYASQPGCREQLIQGWKLFLDDLKNFVMPDEEPIKPAGKVIKELPALLVDIEGSVKSSNLATYKDFALDYIRNVKTKLESDQDFADANSDVKFCERVEGELVLAKKQILTKAVSINEILTTIDSISEEHRQTRLKLSKLIDSEKESRKLEILNKAVSEWNSRLTDLNEKLKVMGGVFLPTIAIDIAGAMKGKRTIDTLRSAANDEVMRATITANTTRIAIEKNLAIINDIGAKHLFLFADKQQLVIKDSEALEAICKQRIADHDAADKKRIDDAAEALANEKIRKQKEADGAAQAEKDHQEADRVAAERFNQQQVSKPNIPVTDYAPHEVTDVYFSTKQEPQQSTFLEPLAAKTLTTIEQVQRDFETVNGLAPALAAIITKSIFDGQHKCLQIKNA